MGGWGGGSSEAGEGVRRGAAVTEASALGPSAPCVCGQHEFYRSDSDSIARSCSGRYTSRTPLHYNGNQVVFRQHLTIANFNEPPGPGSDYFPRRGN